MQLIHINCDALSSLEDMLLVHCIACNAKMSAEFARQVGAIYNVRREIQTRNRHCPVLVINHRGPRKTANLIT